MENYNQYATDAHKEVLYGMANRQLKTMERVKINNGQSIFKMDITNGDINVANYSIEKGIDPKSKKQYNSYKFLHEPNVIYIVALNKKNAEKKLFNILVFVDMIVKSTPKVVPNDASLSLRGVGDIVDDKPDKT